MNTSLSEATPSIHVRTWRPSPPELAVGIVLALLPIVFLAVALAGLYVPALVVGLWLLSVPVFITWVAAASSDRAALLALVSATMLARVAVGAVLLAVMQKAVFHVFDDTVRYDEIGGAIAASWRAGTNPDLFRQYALSVAGFYYVVAAFDYLSEGGPLLIVTFNAAFAGATALLVNQLAVDLGVVRRSRLLAVTIASFMPSVLFWASIPLKDTLVSFLLVAGVVAAFHLAGRRGLIALGALSGSIVLLSTLRLYGTLFLVLIALLVIATMGLWRRRPIWSAVIVAVVATVQVYSFQGPVATQMLSAATEVAELERQQEIYGQGGSAPGAGASSAPAQTPIPLPVPSTSEERFGRYLGVLAHIPVAVMQYFVLPIPFVTPGALVLAALPEMLIWYPGLLLAAVGFWEIGRRKRAAGVVIIMLVLSMAAVYGTIVSNAGSLMRYRAQGVVLLAVPVAVGLVWLWQWQRQRRSAVARS
jgi:hypothetical protein